MNWRWLRGAVMAAVIMTSMAWASRAPFQMPDGDRALLRLSWRMRGERLETCRALTQAELDKLPVHMRTPTQCEGRSMVYALSVQIDDLSAESSQIEPAGAKGDRPIFVLHETALTPGPHHVRIRFGAVSHGDVPRPAIVMDTVINFTAGHVELVTLSGDARSLVMRSAR